MPFTVITLVNTPKSLRGDLTKWMQEIATGVYIGNFNAKIREELWNRIIENVGRGEATISYYCRNEIGYFFKTHNSKRKLIDFEGIPLVIVEKNQEFSEIELGFSNAYKFRKSRKYRSISPCDKSKKLVFLDIETDGLDENYSNIIEIGAVKIGEQFEEFHRLIKIDKSIPVEIRELTGIKDEDLKTGSDLFSSLKDFMDFIKNYDLIGYNINFDIKFLNYNLAKFGINSISNNIYDLMKFVKKDNMFLSDYKLQTVLDSYKIKKIQTHRALEDAKLCYELSTKVNKFIEFIKIK